MFSRDGVFLGRYAATRLIQLGTSSRMGLDVSRVTMS